MTIQLISLHVENFRGVRDFTLRPEGGSVTVFGANGTGKSTLAAAFVWLLTGKDAQGRDNYNLFPLDADGKRVPGCAPMVTAVLLADGRETVLTRSIAEKWTKRRGAASAEYAGDETRFSIDEVPMSAGEYARRVSDFAPEHLLTLLTNASWFSEQTKDYKERRKYLMTYFGGVEAADVFAAHTELEPLRGMLGTHSVDELSKILSDRRKRLRDALTAIPARIDENRKQLPDALPDVRTVTAKRSALNVEIAKAQYELEHTDVASARRKIERELADAEERLRSVPAKRRAMEAAANAKYDAARAQAMARAVRDQTEAAAELNALESERADVQRKLDRAQARRNELREEWVKVSSEEPDVKDVCPTCGQALPADRVRDALDLWNSSRAERLARIAEEGTAAGSRIEELERLLSSTAARADAARAKNDCLTDAIRQIEAQTPAGPPAMSKELDEEETSLSALCEQLRAQLSDCAAEADHAQRALTDRISEMQQQSDALTAQLAEIDRARAMEKRIGELEAEQRETLRSLEEAEHGIELCQDFTRALVSMLTERVNARFSTVRFRLFEEQKNGGLREVCEASVDGVPYGALNTAAKLRANVEIAAAFGRAAGASMPLFLDNRESVTELDIPSGMQVVNLIVKPGAPLGTETEV